ncbi:MAG: hypothetical protein ACRDTR_12595 [Rubrobacter sp.]
MWPAGRIHYSIRGTRHQYERTTRAIDERIFKAVIQEIAETREGEEIGCDECFEQVDRFIEMELSGLDPAEAMPLVQEHLHMCGECSDEFEALLAAVMATMEGGANPPDAG